MAPIPSSPSGRHWPWMIALGLLLVIVVNVLFAWVAVSGADPVVSSYDTESR